GRPMSAETLRVALTAVDLDRFAHARVRTFSVGMQRRLALARLTLSHPRVILLDEPFAGLDQQAGKWVDEYLAAFKAGGGTVLLTTHSFGRGLGVADRIVILTGGTVVLDTPAATLSPDDVRRCTRPTPRTKRELRTPRVDRALEGRAGRAALQGSAQRALFL